MPTDTERLDWYELNADRLMYRDGEWFLANELGGIYAGKIQASGPMATFREAADLALKFDAIEDAIDSTDVAAQDITDTVPFEQVVAETDGK